MEDLIARIQKEKIIAIVRGLPVDTVLKVVQALYDGGIRFVESPCPDHTCESFGVLTKQGDWAACLPARAKLSVVQKNAS